jgi:hypothetical protein
MPNKVKGRQGEELFSYVPKGTIERVDKARGPYFTRSKFVLYALDRAIEEANSGTLRFDNKIKTPLGAAIHQSTPSGTDTTNTTPNPPQESNPKEVLGSVS